MWMKFNIVWLWLESQMRSNFFDQHFIHIHQSKPNLLNCNKLHTLHYIYFDCNQQLFRFNDRKVCSIEHNCCHKLWSTWFLESLDSVCLDWCIWLARGAHHLIQIFQTSCHLIKCTKQRKLSSHSDSSWIRDYLAIHLRPLSSASLLLAT